MAKKKNGFIDEFKKFISQGSVMDLAVGMVIGAAFTAIVTSLPHHRGYLPQHGPPQNR